MIWWLLPKPQCQLQEYLGGANNQNNEYWKYRYGALGYYMYPAKSGFRLLTGKELRPEKTLPDSLSGITIPLVNAIEQHMIKIVDAIATPFFGLSTEEVAKKLDIPLILPENDETAHFGMVDIACYHNKVNQKERPPMNCVAHYDPGILSLSVIQTNEGLQLLDKNGNWINGPTPQSQNLGVIWTGDAAKSLNGSFKAGIHQVIYPETLGTPRLSIWGEVCTRDQALIDDENSYLAKNKNKQLKFNGPSKIMIPNIFGREEKNKYIVAVEPGKLLEALQLVEQVQGLPYSKVMKVPVYNDQGEVTGIKSGW